MPSSSVPLHCSYSSWILQKTTDAHCQHLPRPCLRWSYKMPQLWFTLLIRISAFRKMTDFNDKWHLFPLQNYFVFLLPYRDVHSLSLLSIFFTFFSTFHTMSMSLIVQFLHLHITNLQVTDHAVPQDKEWEYLEPPRH